MPPPPAFRAPRRPPGYPVSQVPNCRPRRPAPRLPNWPPGCPVSRVPRPLRPRYLAPSGLAAWPGSCLAARWFLAALCGPCPERASAASRSLPSPTPLSAKSLTICSGNGPYPRSRVRIAPIRSHPEQHVRLQVNAARSRVSCWPVLGDNRIKGAFDAVRAVANARLTRLRAGAPASLGVQQRALRRRRGLNGGRYPERVPEPMPRARTRARTPSPCASPRPEPVREPAPRARARARTPSPCASQHPEPVREPAPRARARARTPSPRPQHAETPGPRRRCCRSPSPPGCADVG
jgi:hypothetical protein